MAHYAFEWDSEKARANEQNHNVGFDEARSSFLDVFAIESFDRDHSDDEERFMLMGMSDRERVLLVAFTLRNHATIRIVSARLARRQERLQYEEKNTSR